MDVHALTALPALSIRQPWASLIAAGDKSIELRNWATDYRGWIWLHASRQVDLKAMELLDLRAADFPTGGLLGIGQLSTCQLIRSRSEWLVLKHEHRSPGEFVAGVYAWSFDDVIALREKIAVRGELRLFTFDESTRHRLQIELTTSASNQEFVGAVDSV